MTFAVSGKLWRDALVMYDRETLTLWSQITGEAMAGPTQNIRLPEIPSQMTTWVIWQKRHPDTLVLVKPKMKRSAYQPYHRNPHRMGMTVAPKGDVRFPPKTMVFGLARDGMAVALPLEDGPRPALFQFQLGDKPMMVITAETGTHAVAFGRAADQFILNFSLAEGPKGEVQLKDDQSNSSWDWETGKCIAGLLMGKELEAIAGTPVFWSVWSRYYPATRIVSKTVIQSPPSTDDGLR